MQRLTDPYRVLGVGRDATAVEIKAAHRRLAKRLHPDAPQADAEAFLSVQDAYELLSDPLRRTEWDRKHAPGPVRAGESPRSAANRAGRPRAGQRPARPAPARSASAPPEHAEAAAGPRPRQRTASPPDAAAGPDLDPFSRSSGAAWSSASRAFFRRTSADMPSGAAHPNTPRWTTPLGGTPPPRYGAPRPRPAAGPAEGPAASERGVVIPHERALAHWPNPIQRAEAGLVAALPLVGVAAFAAFDRLGARGAELAALAALVVLWALFLALPRAAWVGSRGAVGALFGAGAYLLLGLLLPPETPVFTSFLLLWLTVGAGYFGGLVLALRDLPVRRPWLPLEESE